MKRMIKKPKKVQLMAMRARRQKEQQLLTVMTTKKQSWQSLSRRRT